MPCAPKWEQQEWKTKRKKNKKVLVIKGVKLTTHLHIMPRSRKMEL
jgi:hypothetical protein